MPALLYSRLIGFTAGTLLTLFWMVVILGYRRQRNFERVFFFLCLALFLFYSGSLLALNSQLYYAQPPETLNIFSWTVLCLGLCFLPPLLVHLHAEYAASRALLVSPAHKRLWLAAFYTPAIYFVLRAYPQLTVATTFNFLTPGNSLGRGFGIWLVASLLFCAVWEARFASHAPDLQQRLFHRSLGGLLLVAAALTTYLHVFNRFASRHPSAFADRTWLSTGLALLPILPLGLLVYFARKFNFLQIGRQQNLLYAVSVTFFALLYLSLVRRVSLWLEPVLPPEASAAILLFLLVVFIEPLQRVLGRRLRETAQQEMDQAQRIAAAIQEIARQGSQSRLISFTQQCLKEQLELADTLLVLSVSRALSPGYEHADARWLFPIARGDHQWIGYLSVRPHGAMLSGETRAALEFLCEQLPSAFDLCRLIEEKLHLERELAERERLAALGQMAASISHNLKNPLGSIKTILQLQLENPDMPDSLKPETSMVLAEINRLSSKLNQLLQFSRPPILGQHVNLCCDAADILREVTEVLRPEADRRGVALIPPNSPASTTKQLPVAIARDALHDILSNLLVNALDAASPGGHITVTASQSDGFCSLTVEDDGPGIPAATQEKILQPFFTTKPQGTGLGLAIVARRVADAGGRLDWQSPIADSRGTRFFVHLPEVLGLGEKLKS